MTALLLPALLLLGAGTPDVGAPIKCRDTPAGTEPVYLLDGELVPAEGAEAVFADIGTENVHAVEILCMNPEDSTLNRTSGLSVVAIWTKSGPAGQIEPTLTALVAAQDGHRRLTSRYADDVSDIELPTYPPELRLQLDTRDDGWVATITLDRYFRVCYVFDGEIPAPAGGLSPRQPECVAAPEGTTAS